MRPNLEMIPASAASATSGFSAAGFSASSVFSVVSVLLGNNSWAMNQNHGKIGNTWNDMMGKLLEYTWNLCDTYDGNVGNW